MTLAAYTNQRLIMPNLRRGDAASVISEMTQALHADGVISDSLAFYHAALNREFLAPTQVSGVGFPHARSQVATRLAFAVGRSLEPVAWGPRGDKVNLVILIAIPPSCAGEYLNLMAGFASLIRDPILRHQMLDASGSEEIQAVLQSINSRTSALERPTAEVDR